MKKWCDNDGVDFFGANGRKRVMSKFSFDAFQDQLDRAVQQVYTM